MLSFLFLFLTKGNPGDLTIPLATIMWFLALLSFYPAEPPSIRLSCLPVPFVLMLARIVPVFFVIPALLLSDHLIAYAVFCGVGYPAIAFLVRKASIGWSIARLQEIECMGISARRRWCRCFGRRA